MKINKSNNPMMDFVSVQEYNNAIKNQINKLNNNQNVLDIGGGRGKTFKTGVANYYVLDLSSHNDKMTIVGDITSKNLKIDKKFDLIISKDTFEHILNPWDATDNILDLLNEGGLFFCSVPFNWRFHPSPYDAYRYSHQGLKYLFERNGKLEELYSGYIHYYNNVRGFWGNRYDYWPINNIHKDCICSFYVGKKNNLKQFDINEIKGDFSHDHK